MNERAASMAGPPSGANRINMTSMLAGFALGAVLASLAWVQVVPGETSPQAVDAGNFVPVYPGEPVPGGEDGDGGPQVERRVVGSGGDAADGGDVGGGVDVDGGAGPGAVGGGGGGPGGSGSAPGVSDQAIRFGATYVSGGIAEGFLGEVRDAMEAVRNRVNKSGGVHGRQIEIDYKADDWVPDTGKRFIENLIKDGVFAFAVSPSSEGLNQASLANLFKDNGVPVVGADGLNNTQFLDPWIWPVATATTTNVHIIMKEAHERAEKAGTELHPAIVFGNTYRFGVEGAYAFNQAYERLSDEDIPGYGDGETSCKPNSRYCGIPGDFSQGPQTGAVEDACKAQGEDLPKCNFLLLLLEPATAQNWMENFRMGPSDFSLGMAGAQPLFTTDFGNGCGKRCEGMVVWTGYNPPTGEFTQRDEVVRYTRDFKQQKNNADVHNQFSLGGYIGMELLVQALEEAGPDLTRKRLVEALNSTTLETGLTASPKLSWSSSKRYANAHAHGYEMTWNTAQGKFAGFVRKSGDYVEDPWIGQDNRPPGS